MQRLLAQRDHAGFLEAFCNASMQSAARYNDYVRALAGEGLCLLLQDQPSPSLPLLARYADLLLAGMALAPAATVRSVAKRLHSSDLYDLAVKLRRREKDSQSNRSRPSTSSADPPTDRGPVIQVRRVIQKMHMFLGDAVSSDSRGIRQSVFRSQQERAFLHALALRFPALLALPNYPLDQIADLERIRKWINKETWIYGARCRLDAVLVVPDAGDPVAVFELDSRLHDTSEAAHRDHMKNHLVELIGLPFFRLRVESPESMSTDEWYTLLTDEVAPYLDIGRRIRCRMPDYSLIPV